MKKMPIDDPGGNKNSVGGNTSPASSAPAAIAVNSPTRRDLLQVGAGLAVAASGGSQGLAAPAVKRKMINVPRAPNIIVLMTDQERHHMHWPDWGWSGWNPPNSGNAIQEMQGTPFGFFDGLNSLGGGNPNNDGRYVSGDINATPGQIRGWAVKASSTS